MWLYIKRNSSILIVCASEKATKTIRELEIRNKTGANIIGLKTGDGEYIINPEPDTVMKPDAKLFVLGTQDQVTKLLQVLSA